MNWTEDSEIDYDDRPDVDWINRAIAEWKKRRMVSLVLFGVATAGAALLGWVAIMRGGLGNWLAAGLFSVNAVYAWFTIVRLSSRALRRAYKWKETWLRVHHDLDNAEYYLNRRGGP